jgi:flavin reductase (DIM6/NTAB) family NADH-FMN oxidoreductase RutF
MSGLLTDDVAAAPLVELPTGAALWEQVFTVAPLVLVTTKEGDRYDVAPKHMALPLGWDGHYGFVCTPEHATYRNVVSHGVFTVSVPRPNQVVQTSLAAGGRLDGGLKPSLAAVPTIPARVVEGRLVAGCAFYLECELDRIVDGFGTSSLVAGRTVAASAAPDVLRGADVDDADLVHRSGVLVYLAQGRFAVVRESLAFPFTADFHR